MRTLYASLAFFLAQRRKQFYYRSFNSSPSEMEDHVQIHPSASQEAIDCLVYVVVDRAQAKALLRPIEPSSVKSNGNSQSETPRLEALEERMFSMMESFSQRLDQLAAKIGGTNDVRGTSTEILTTPTPWRQSPHSWADRDINETPDCTITLHWPDEEDANGQSLIEVSEPTATLLSASIATRLSLKKTYSSKLNVATRAIPLAPLFYRNLQIALSQALDRSG